MSSVTKKNKKTKDASHAYLIELIQSQCIHRRRQVVFEEGRNFIKCLDCGKNFKKLEIEIATQGKPKS